MIRLSRSARTAEVLNALHFGEPADCPPKSKDLVLSRKERVLREPLARVRTDTRARTELRGGRLVEAIRGDANGIELFRLARLALKLDALEIEQGLRRRLRRGGPVEECIEGHLRAGDELGAVVVELIDERDESARLVPALQRELRHVRQEDGVILLGEGDVIRRAERRVAERSERAARDAA